ncbi:MAG: hypothetical protein IJA69_05290 [Clostridia bacterium]|nr:hypothetical protein [Clostridia bacterium]
MNIFGRFGNVFGGSRGGCDCCSLIWLMFLLSICGCNNRDYDEGYCGGGGNDCCSLIFLLILLGCVCKNNTPCNN